MDVPPQKCFYGFWLLTYSLGDYHSQFWGSTLPSEGRCWRLQYTAKVASLMGQMYDWTSNLGHCTVIVPYVPYFQTNACSVLSSGAFLLSVFVAVTNIILLLLQLVLHAVLVWSYVSASLNWSESGGTEPHLFAQAYYGIRSGWLCGGKTRLLIHHNDFPSHDWQQTIVPGSAYWASWMSCGT
jgi:hypothetical protein